MAFIDILPIEKQLANLGVEVRDHWCGGIYVKETHIPADRVLSQHVHAHDHLSWLGEGSVLLEVDGVGEIVKGPVMLTIPAHKQHKVTSITPVIWLCIWNEDRVE